MYKLGKERERYWTNQSVDHPLSGFLEWVSGYGASNTGETQVSGQSAQLGLNVLGVLGMGYIGGLFIMVCK